MIFFFLFLFPLSFFLGASDTQRTNCCVGESLWSPTWNGTFSSSAPLLFHKPLSSSFFLSFLLHLFFTFSSFHLHSSIYLLFHHRSDFVLGLNLLFADCYSNFIFHQIEFCRFFSPPVGVSGFFLLLLIYQWRAGWKVVCVRASRKYQSTRSRRLWRCLSCLSWPPPPPRPRPFRSADDRRARPRPQTILFRLHTHRCDGRRGPFIADSFPIPQL